MIHKIEHDDVYKILPFLIDGNPKWGLEVSSIVTKSGKLLVYDDSNLLKRVYQLWRKEKGQNKINFSTRYCFNIYINGEIKAVSFGRSIMDIIMKNRPTIFDLDSNTHLRIHKEFIGSHIGPLPDFSKSNIIEVEDWSDKEDWYEFIQKNQPDYIGYIKSKNPIKMRSYLTEEFGHDYIGDIITKEREDKINKIIN